MWLWHPQRQHDNLQDVTFPKNYLPCAYELLKCNDLLFGRLLHCDYRYRFHPPCLLVSSWFHQSMLLTSWFSVTIHVWVSIQSSVILLIYAYMILCVYPYASLKRKHTRFLDLIVMVWTREPLAYRLKWTTGMCFGFCLQDISGYHWYHSDSSPKKIEPFQKKNRIPSGKHTKSYGKSPCSMGKSTINGHVQ
jgi:hypothetical protein